ncbi:MAG: PIN domain-containing protein [Verrucomicrobiota bacterium]
MAERLIADTGAILALVNGRDEHHDWAVSCFRGMSGSLVTCEAVLTECWHFVGGSVEALGMLVSMVEKRVLRVGFDFEENGSEVLGLLEKYRDTPMDFADACLVRMTELEKKSRVWTVDADFKIYRRNQRQVVPVLAPW